MTNSLDTARTNRASTKHNPIQVDLIEGVATQATPFVFTTTYETRYLADFMYRVDTKMAARARSDNATKSTNRTNNRLQFGTLASIVHGWGTGADQAAVSHRDLTELGRRIS